MTNEEKRNRDKVKKEKILVIVQLIKINKVKKEKKGKFQASLTITPITMIITKDLITIN